MVGRARVGAPDGAEGVTEARGVPGRKPHRLVDHHTHLQLRLLGGMEGADGHTGRGRVTSPHSPKHTDY